MKNKKSYKTSIGGQAVIEGIMMKGPSKTALAVRTPSGDIDLTIEEQSRSPFMKKIAKLPFIRGIFVFIESIVGGMKYITVSAEKSGMADEEDEEPGKFSLWLHKVFGENLMKIVTTIGIVLGVILAVALFMLFPAWIVSLIDKVFPLYWAKSLIEGIIKIALFITYLALVSKMSEIKRTFEYHGAEHKTIFCYEHGEELTVENVKKQSRFHPRCGTSFLIIVLIISILVFSVVSWSNVFLRTVIKLALLPVVMGISFELLKLAGRYDNVFTRIISAPGMLLQHLTTREPDNGQIEAAIAAIEPVLPQEGESDKW